MVLPSDGRGRAGYPGGMPKKYKWVLLEQQAVAPIQAGSSANTWLKGKTDPSWVYGYDSTTVALQEPAAA